MSLIVAAGVPNLGGAAPPATSGVAVGPLPIGGTAVWSARGIDCGGTGEMRYSGVRVIWQGLTGNKGWGPAWRNPAPKGEYDIVIIGGGGHGLSTAFYLAKEHGLTNVAVLEKGYLGGGSIGRNTTIVRANYVLPGNSEFYSHSLKLWEKLDGELNYNVMHSQRGLINLFHSDG